MTDFNSSETYVVLSFSGSSKMLAVHSYIIYPGLRGIPSILHW